MIIKNKEDYVKAMFEGVPNDEPTGKVPSSHKEAIKFALDIRKFEIELYWKRATYFWTFIGASFVAYFALVSSAQGDELKDYIFLVTIIGFIFSYF